jgi:hypothetical protein
VICPDDALATLGKIIGQMKAAPGKWTVQLHPPPGAVVPIKAVIGMMELLWKSQLDRHGTAVAGAPFSPSSDEAVAALHLALTLVHWFNVGVVTKA